MASETHLGTAEDLEPGVVWKLFAGIAAVPRPSKKEERVRAHVRAVAEEHGLTVRQDSIGNLLVDVPATPGCESAPITVLQAHLDMVCEKNAGVTHDFDRDPIRLILDKDPAGEQIVRADATTLGADNGMGVAMALAVAFSSDATHGPLELLFTIDEEAGMSGAKAVTPEFFHGRRLLNLDSEEDDILCIGCAGGCDTTLAWTCTGSPIDKGAEVFRVVVDGLRGGHSGCDIHENRGSAIKLLVRTLLGIDSAGLRLVSLDGGSLRNAIPREATAVVAGQVGLADTLRQAAQQVQEEACRESAEQGLSIRVEPVTNETSVVAMSRTDTGCLLSTLAALPHGVLGMHPSVPGLVQTSNNLATVRVAPGESSPTLDIHVGTLSRSSSASLLRVTLAQIASVGRLAGARIETANGYPGWEPNLDSPVLGTCRRVYETVMGEPPKVAAIHAGLECGIIGERVSGMDMVSLGPRIEGAHSPDERVWVASVQKSWKYLLAILAELSTSD